MTQPALPAAYQHAAMAMLGQAESEAFLQSYTSPRTYGLRINTLKTSLGSPAVQRLTDLFALRPVPWCETGFYYDETTRPGKHPDHTAGLYYIQEPSAMSAVELLNPQPGETVLDLAAAPGGKTTQIAAKMAGQGLLISNEIHPQRARILAENVERLGIQNAVVTQAAPPELSARFPFTFDRIMLDAPCSGEGMFRKDPEAIIEWSPEAVEQCAARQWDILQDAIAMLKPGGRIAYSTCTFNRRENEETIARLIATHPFLRLIEEKRIWPHLQEGEGHYVALLERDGEADPADKIMLASPSHRGRGEGGRPGRSSRPAKGNAAGRDTAAAWDAFLTWAAEELPAFHMGDGSPLLFGEALYLLPRSRSLAFTPEHLIGLKIPRAGLHLGDYRKGRFEPAHALAMVLGTAQVKQTYELSEGSPEINAFLRGETLNIPLSQRGWHLVTMACGSDSFPLGWGKASGGQLKNHLPKGLRQMY